MSVVDEQALAWEKMVKENAALIAAAKVNPELLVTAKREAVDHEMAANLAIWASTRFDWCFVRNRQTCV